MEGRLPERDRPWVMRTYAGHSSADAPATRCSAATSTRGRRACRWRSTCRRRPATTPTTRWPPARSAGSACRSRTSATCGRSSTASRSAGANTSMTINATAMWLLALYVVVAAGAGRGRRGAGRHDAERHRQGVPVPRHLHLPAGPVAAADHRHDRVDGGQRSAVEPDQRLLLPPAGGRRDAGAGGRVRARDGGRGARRGARLGSGARRADGRRGRSGCRSSSTPACGSSRRWRRCARSRRSGTRSPRAVRRSTTPGSDACGTACRSTRSA